jgi:hypothetical protein
MSPISLSLDLLMMLLLVAALGFGWRLEQRLKSLRQSHADFAGAVADLDRAAQRAETGLAQLRQATDEAADLLAGRIEKARELAGRLETLTREAATATPRPANDLIRPAATRPAPARPVQARPVPARAPAAPAPLPRSPVDAVLAAEALARRLSDDDSLVLRHPAPRAAAPSPQPMRRAATPARPVPSIDDDLFEAPQRAAMGGTPRRR